MVQMQMGIDEQLLIRVGNWTPWRSGGTLSQKHQPEMGNKEVAEN